MKSFLQSKLAGKRVLILGFGREGKSTLRLLKDAIPLENITVADKNVSALVSDEFISKSGIKIIYGDNYLKGLSGYDVIIKSPGISLKDVDTTGYKENITSQADLFLARYGDQTTGITGTKGKSTTSSLLYHILKSYNDNVLFGGNIGIPLFDLVYEINPETKIVCELSSHQLEFTNHSPHIAILLNLFQEHLDHYNSYMDYQLAKYNIALHQKPGDYFIYTSSDKHIDYLIKDTPAKGEKLPFSLSENTNTGISVSGNDIVIRKFRADSQILDRSIEDTTENTDRTTDVIDLKVVETTDDLLTSDTNQSIDELKVLPLNFFTNLEGKHNRNNAIIASAAAALQGIPAKVIEDSLTTFQPLEHRLEFVGKVNGVKYYNDSISTIPEAAIAAIESLNPVHTIILGGFDRGIDYILLIEYLLKGIVKNIVTTGPAGKHIHELLSIYRPVIESHYFEKFDDAVMKAIELTPANGVCLLSPAASSYNEFTNFEERGKRFKELVNNIQH